MSFPLRSAFRATVAPLRRTAALAPSLARGATPEEHVFNEADPETNKPRNSVVRFRMATSTYNSRTQEEDTMWHIVESKREYLNAGVMRAVHVGSLVYVEGSLKTKSYTDRNEVERQEYFVKLDAFQKLKDSQRFEEQQEEPQEQAGEQQ